MSDLKFQQLNREEYLKFTAKQKYLNFLQSVESYDLFLVRDYNPILVGLVDSDNQVIAGGILSQFKVHGGFYYRMDRGPILDFKNSTLVKTFFDGLYYFAKTNGALYISIIPDLVATKFNNEGAKIFEDNTSLEEMKKIGFIHVPIQMGNDTNHSPSFQYVKDLSGIEDEKQLTDSFTKDVQYYLKKNKQFGIELKILDEADLKDFYQLEVATANRIGFKAKELDYYQKAYKYYGNKTKFIFAFLDFKKYKKTQNQAINELMKIVDDLNLRLKDTPNNKKIIRQLNEYNDQIKAHHKRIEQADILQSNEGKDKVITAGAMFQYFPGELTYLYSGTNEAYKNFYSPYLIQQFVMQEAIKLGINRYNFYGVSGKQDGSDGVMEFKKSFNGELEEMIGEFILPINKFKYNLIQILKKITGR